MKSFKGFLKNFVIMFLVTVFTAITVSETVLAVESSDLVGLEMELASKTIYVGNKIDLKAYGVYKESTIELRDDVKYESNNKKVFTIEDKKIVAVSTGMAILTASYKDKTVTKFVVVQDLKALENKLDKNNLQIKLNWKREPNSIELKWDKVEALKFYTISRRAVGEENYKTIVERAEGNLFLDETIDLDKEYEYQVALIDDNGAKYPLNNFKVPLYHEEEKEVSKVNKEQKAEVAKEKNVNINEQSKSDATPNKANTVQLSNEEYEKLLQKLKEQSEQEFKEHSFKAVSEDLYGVEDLIVINKDNTEVINRELTLSYYYDNNIKIDENKLTIYAMDDKGLLTEQKNVKLEVSTKKISFLVKQPGIYMIRERAEQQEIVTYVDEVTENKADKNEASTNLENEANVRNTKKDEQKQENTNQKEDKKSDENTVGASTEANSENKSGEAQKIAVPDSKEKKEADKVNTFDTSTKAEEEKQQFKEDVKDTSEKKEEPTLTNKEENSKQPPSTEIKAVEKVNITEEFIESTLDTELKINQEYIEKHNGKLSFKYIIANNSNTKPEALGIYSLENNEYKEVGKEFVLDKEKGLINITLDKAGSYFVKDKASILPKQDGNNQPEKPLEDKAKPDIANNKPEEKPEVKEENPLTTKEGKFEAGIAGLFSEATSLEKDKLSTYLNKLPKENGIWIPEKDRQFVLNLINYISSKKYYINEKGYLKSEEKGIIDSLKSDIFSKLLDKLINGDKRIILSKDNGFVYYDDKTDALLKSKFTTEESYKLINETSELIILNSKVFEELESGKLSNELALKLLNQLDESSRESNATILKEISDKKPKTKLRVVSRVALYATIGTPSTVQMLQGNAVYTGPDTVNYVNIGSVDTNEMVTGFGAERGWLYIEYSTANGPKRGFVPLTSVKDKEDVFSRLGSISYTGYSDGLTSDSTIYSGPGTNYVSVGTVYNGEGITVFNKTQNGFVYIEYSSSSGTKRGFVQANLLMGRKRGFLGSAKVDTPTYSGPGNQGTYVSIGSVNNSEFVIALEWNDNWYHVEYNTKSGRKRGYTDRNNIADRGSLSDALYIRSQQYRGISSTAQTTYTGPYSTYATLGSIENQERVSVLTPDEYGYAYIEYSTPNGLKRGYVPSNTISKAEPIVLPTISVQGVQANQYGTSGEGRSLNVYRVGNGKNALVAVFAIHGFEDAWASDGLELVKIAANLISNVAGYSAANGGLDVWSVYIVPCANPDGVIDGITNNGPGRTTIKEGIDLNRDFPDGFSIFTNPRNKTGNTSLIPSEAKALANLVNGIKAQSDEMVVLDIHGWENTTIGNSEIGGYFDKEFGFAHKGGLNGQGYFSSWAQSIGAKATLVELPWPSNSQDIINRAYSQKVSNAVINILKSNIGKLPSVMNLDYPTNDLVLKGDFNVEGWALVQTGVSRVEVYLDGKLQGNASLGISRPDVKNAYPKYENADTSGFRYTINEGAVSPGNHTILARVIGRDGSSIESSRNIVKLIPRINIDSLTEGQNISSSLKVYGWSLNQSGVSQVKVYIDGNFIVNATTGLSRPDVKKSFSQYDNAENSGFLYNLDINTLKAGNHNIKIESIGNDGNVVSQSKNVTIAKAPVMINIESVSTYDNDSNNLMVRGWSLNPSGVKSVKILIDGNFKNYAVTEIESPKIKEQYPSYINADKSGFEYAIEVSELANGDHTVTAIATGNDGSYAQQTMGFNVNVSNSGSKVTALTLIGSFLGGIKDAAADNLQGMFQIITHPIKSAEAVGFLLYAANNKDSEEYKMLMEMVKNELDEIANKFTNGDGNVKARMIGRAVGELFIAVVGPKGIKQGLELLSKVSKGTKLGSLVQKGMTAAEALNITEGAAEAVSKIRTVSSDFLNYVSGKVVKLRDGLGFRPAFAGGGDSEELLTILNNSEISNMSKIESIAGAAGRYLSIDEVASDIAGVVKKVRFRGTVLDLMDDSGKVLRRVVVPEGYRSTQQLLYKAFTGEIDVTKWGYTNANKLEETINNVNRYLNRTDLNRAPSLINSKNAGKVIDFGGGIVVEYDPLGFPIFKGNQVKVDLQIVDDVVVKQKGLSNMASEEHMKVATRKFKSAMQQESNKSGQTLESYLKNKGFNDVQISDIINEESKIRNYTWHHHPETGRMQLVDETTHATAKHNGGDSIWGSGSADE
ncbi:Ig-like domain-containing protein [Clostridium manihotivorum]|uniref:Uncharacterized protein n=1 Tax=Clostridium manihotivorum TaxID=2320868 RepID=A0A410DYL3_9CLOT|nr:Ig-like domain-containing protein [Clostridium manihotivorum]QAA34161.1 hypothetical protein C1I91_22410 [Clostridium manihotivorum]